MIKESWNFVKIASDSSTLVVDFASRVSFLFIQNLKLYPNPSNDYATV